MQRRFLPLAGDALISGQRTLFTMVLHPYLGTPIHLRSQSLKSLSAIEDVSFPWSASPPYSPACAHAYRDLQVMPVTCKDMPLRPIWSVAARTKWCGKPPYGDVCTRDTGRILTRARAFPQIVGSREEEEGKGRAKEGIKGSIRPGTSADGGDGRSYSLHGGA